MIPGARLHRRPPDRAPEIGLGHPIEHRVVAHPGHVGRAPLLERAEQALLGRTPASRRTAATWQSWRSTASSGGGRGGAIRSPVSAMLAIRAWKIRVW